MSLWGWIAVLFCPGAFHYGWQPDHGCCPRTKSRRRAREVKALWRWLHRPGTGLLNLSEAGRSRLSGYHVHDFANEQLSPIVFSLVFNQLGHEAEDQRAIPTHH